MNTEEKKIAVIGIGGVGGYIAGLLAKGSSNSGYGTAGLYFYLCKKLFFG